jgi:hypothetical protein
MLKVFCAFGLGIAFLIISAELRGSLMELIDGLGHLLAVYSPLSYVCVGVAGLLGAMIWVYRAAQPR